MKHFHLSQGDKLAGLDGPLYLQKKIKSVLTLAPFIGNTCWLVIVLNSISRARPRHTGLLSRFRTGWGWPWNSPRILCYSRGSVRGHSWAELAEEFCWASCLLEQSAFPSPREGCPCAPCLLPPPPSLSGDWKGSKGPEALIEPNGLPSCLDVFAEREIKGWEIFPGGPDRVLQLRGGILPALGRAFQMLIGT